MPKEPWKILIVDDESEIHVLTRTVLKEVSFDDRPLEFYSAYNTDQTKAILANHSDIALILMDVVMDSDDSGLELIRYIRNDLNNRLTRIILRTGQPGEAPERRIIIDYEINDYREKVNLSSSQLFTSVVKSLRNYKDLIQIRNLNEELRKSRDGLSTVIETSARLFETRSLPEFREELLRQSREVLSDSPDAMIVDAEYTEILSASGEWETQIGKSPMEVLGQDFTSSELRSEEESACCVDDEFVVTPIGSGDRSGLFVIARSQVCKRETDWKRVNLFFNNANIVHRNLALEEDALATQSDMIQLLGDVVENRSQELQGHVNRVRGYAELLAGKLDYSPEDTAILRDAAPMHDIGKIGIFDAILLKPGPLSREEFEQMKAHTTIGYEILRYSSRKLFQTAAIIAREHHERWDGKGYPRGLKGHSIHELGRIVCIADAFDALTSDRVYRDAWDFDRTVKFIKDESGSQFDPSMVEMFLDDLDLIYEIMIGNHD